MRPFKLCLVASVIVAASGCGTASNLVAPPTGMHPLANCCPFGGVVRSSAFGLLAPTVGMSTILGGNIALCDGDFQEGFKQIGAGLWMTSTGLILIADVPVSLAGDILTYPIAYARSRQHPWATWWGEKTSEPAPASDEAEATDHETSSASARWTIDRWRTRQQHST